MSTRVELLVVEDAVVQPDAGGQQPTVLGGLTTQPTDPANIRLEVDTVPFSPEGSGMTVYGVPAQCPNFSGPEFTAMVANTGDSPPPGVPADTLVLVLRPGPCVIEPTNVGRVCVYELTS